jgi:hypothetical protein
MNNTPIGGRSSETLSHPIDMKNKKVGSNEQGADSTVSIDYSQIQSFDAV